MTELEHVTRGSRSDPALVFVHGWPDSWRSFEPVIDALPAHRWRIAVSLRGFGGSTAPHGQLTPDVLAGDVLALLDDLGVTSAVVVGHSMGALVTQRIAVERPDLVAGLVLVGGFSRLDGPVIDELWEIVSSLDDPIDEAFVREFQSSTLAAPIDPGFFEQLVAESRKAPAPVWQAAAAGMRATDHRPLLTQITAPTLLIWGDRDGLVPRSEQDQIVAAIPDARLEVYAGAGHSPNWEQPQRVAADIEAFVTHIG